MGRRPLPKRITALTLRYYAVLADLSASYSPLRGRYQRVTHPFATRSEDLVRLACIRHAASVHPEPGSNSPNRLIRRRACPSEDGALVSFELGTQSKKFLVFSQLSPWNRSLSSLARKT